MAKNALRRLEKARSIKLLIPVLLNGCTTEYKINVAQEKQHTEIATAFKAEDIVLCYSKSLEWAKVSVTDEAKSRFNKPVIIIVESFVKDNRWFAEPDVGDPIEMDEFGLIHALKYQQSDIVIFSNNLGGTKLTSPRVWYFEQSIFINNKAYCPIWKAISQYGYTLEK